MAITISGVVMAYTALKVVVVYKAYQAVKRRRERKANTDNDNDKTTYYCKPGKPCRKQGCPYRKAAPA